MAEAEAEAKAEAVVVMRQKTGRGGDVGMAAAAGLARYVWMDGCYSGFKIYSTSYRWAGG